MLTARLRTVCRFDVRVKQCRQGASFKRPAYGRNVRAGSASPAISASLGIAEQPCMKQTSKLVTGPLSPAFALLCTKKLLLSPEPEAMLQAPLIYSDIKCKKKLTAS